MNTALLKYVLANTPITLEETFEETPEELAKRLEAYIGGLDDSCECDEAVEILNAAVMVAKEYKDSLLLWLVSMTINGCLSVEALAEVTEVAFTLLNGEDFIAPTLTHLDPDSVFYSFTKDVLPEILESVSSARTLFCFREYFTSPKRFKSMINLCCVMAELTTFPDYERYNIDVETSESMAVDIYKGLRVLLQLAYMSTLVYITKGESSLGAAMAKWVKSEVRYLKVYRSICAVLGVVDYEEELSLN